MRRPLLVAWLLLSASACGKAEAASPERKLEDTYATAVAALEAAVGIRLPSPVATVVLTTQQALERRKAFAAGLEQGAGATRGVDLLGHVFISRGNFAGQYYADEKAIYIFEDEQRSGDPDTDRKRLFRTLVHELVHAYDDQTLGLIPDPLQMLSRAAEGDYAYLDSLAVVMTLLEGHATWATELACVKAGVEPPLPMTMADVRDVDTFDGDGRPLLEGFATAGNAIVAAKYLQYVRGREFCRRAMNFGGEAFMREVFTHLPVSPEELADFELFKQRWALEKEAELDAQEAAAGR